MSNYVDVRGTPAFDNDLFDAIMDSRVRDVNHNTFVYDCDYFILRTTEDYYVGYKTEEEDTWGMLEFRDLEECILIFKRLLKGEEIDLNFVGHILYTFTQKQLIDEDITNIVFGTGYNTLHAMFKKENIELDMNILVSHLDSGGFNIYQCYSTVTGQIKTKTTESREGMEVRLKLQGKKVAYTQNGVRTTGQAQLIYEEIKSDLDDFVTIQTTKEAALNILRQYLDNKPIEYALGIIDMIRADRIIPRNNGKIDELGETCIRHIDID